MARANQNISASRSFAHPSPTALTRLTHSPPRAVVRIRTCAFLSAVTSLSFVLVVVSYVQLILSVSRSRDGSLGAGATILQRAGAGRGASISEGSRPNEPIGNEDANENGGRTTGDGQGAVALDGKETTSVSVKATIAYAISITGCGDDNGATMLQGAAVLLHSIRIASAERPITGSRYGYKMFAFVHPSAASCSSSDLLALGYDVQVRETPVNATLIEGKFLRETIQKRGCCQEKELLKLYSYTLMDYPVVVHLDVDSLILKPLDELFDVMIDGPGSDAARHIRVHADAPLPVGGVDFFFTRDYNLVNSPGRLAGIQGGLMVVRPSLAAYEEYRSIVLKGRHFPGSGWGRKGHGGYYGAQQIQGLCAYYYDHVHPGTAVELDRCRYNQMADGPRFGEQYSGECKDGRNDCEDCRTTRLEEIRSAHFTICQKPWQCHYFNGEDIQSRMCNELHGQWHRIRADLEQSLRGEVEVQARNKEGTYRLDFFRGHCNKAGAKGYIPLRIPKEEKHEVLKKT